MLTGFNILTRQEQWGSAAFFALEKFGSGLTFICNPQGKRVFFQQKIFRKLETY
jgi:hypothetical protein